MLGEGVGPHLQAVPSEQRQALKDLFRGGDHRDD